MNRLLALVFALAFVFSMNVFAKPSCGDVFECTKKCDVAGVKWYVEQPGFDPDQRDNWSERTGTYEKTRNFGILHYAAAFNCLSIIKLLDSKGIDMNPVADDIEDNYYAREIFGNSYTPLLYHVKKKNPESPQIIEALISRDNRGLFLIDRNGNSIIHWAAVNNRASLISLLINKGIPVDHYNGAGETPLSLAVLKGSKDAIQVLLTNHAEINNDGNANHDFPIIHKAINKGYTDVAMVLANRGADLTKRNKYNRTAIEEAEVHRNHALQQYLKKDSQYRTPLEDAKIKDYTNLVEYLKNIRDKKILILSCNPYFDKQKGRMCACPAGMIWDPTPANHEGGMCVSN